MAQVRKPVRTESLFCWRAWKPPTVGGWGQQTGLVRRWLAPLVSADWDCGPRAVDAPCLAESCAISLPPLAEVKFVEGLREKSPASATPKTG